MSQEEETNTINQPETSAIHRRRPKWTIMILLAGDNRLSANSLSVLQQLESADIPRNGDVRVLACFDANTPRPRGARYLEIRRRRHTNPNPQMDWGLHNDLVPFETLQELEFHPVEDPDFCETRPTGRRPRPVPDAKEGLSRFLKFALKRHRADRHLLILYGHGTAVAGNTFLADNNPPSFLRLRDFAEVLREHFDVRDDEEQWRDEAQAGTEGQPAPQDQSGYQRKPALDILACDNCIMNGIEAAFEIKGQVKYILGSQGLALAVGWPFRKIINAVVRRQDDRTDRVAESLLRVCARSLIDFTLMERSSEQGLCDVTTLGNQPNVVSAVHGLSQALQAGLRFYGQDGHAVPDGHCPGEVIYPAVRDAVRLARLEAQSFWGERFVDLYDFCELLLEKCNENLSQLYEYDRIVSRYKGAASINLRKIPVMRIFGRIARWCRAVLREIKNKRFVLNSYYVGPTLQYSNGVSIFFPWTLPERPVIFEPLGPKGKGVPAGSYNISWASLSKLGCVPRNFEVKTAFDEYKTYQFAKESGGDWADFLVSFFKATLRDVRRFDFRYVKPKDPEKTEVFFDKEARGERIAVPPEFLNNQKTGSDNESEEDCTCPEIKNYPRRFYVSPADCERRCPVPGRFVSADESAERVEEAADRTDGRTKCSKKPCVSYLGWNIRGLAAEVIRLKQGTYGAADRQGLDEASEEAAADSDELDLDESELDESELDKSALEEEDDDGETEE